MVGSVNWYEFLKRFEVSLKSRSGYFAPDLSLITSHPDCIFESLIEFKGDYEVNDGSWYVFNLFHNKNGETTTKVWCKDEKSLVKSIYSYLLFLRKAGVGRKYELMYYGLKFMILYLDCPHRVFNCNKTNCERFALLVDNALKKDLEDIDMSSRIDPRKFRINPKVLVGLDRSGYTRLQNRIEREIKEMEIKKYYDPKKSLRKNLEVLEENGVDVCRSTLSEFKIKYYGRDKV